MYIGSDNPALFSDVITNIPNSIVSSILKFSLQESGNKTNHKMPLKKTEDVP